MIRILSTLFFILCYCNTKAQDELRKTLNKGNYAVGFRSTVVFDYAQNFPYGVDTSLNIRKYPKPLIINIWYPAVTSGNAQMMPHNGYLEFQSPDKNISKWLNEYREYTENTIAEEVIGKEKSKFDDADKSQFNSFLQLKTIAVKESKALKGKFPLIVYYQGARASIEDNSPFCEMMASNGYVVLGASFQRGDGDNHGVGSTDDGIMDVAFLLSFAQKLPNVDWSHSAMVGHSLGAQTANYIAAKGNFPFDAMISLETTQEYYTDKDNRWNNFVPYVTSKAENVKVEFLFATNPPAIHELADKMKNANRYYLTIPDISHNDFIAQGVQRKYLRNKKNKTPASQIAYENAFGNYTKLCNYMLRFLNAKIKGDATAWNELMANRSARMGYNFFIEAMPAGMKLEDYAGETLPSPTPRQLKILIQSGKTDLAIEQINKTWEKKSKAAVYDPAFSYTMLDYLLHVDTGKAVKLYKAYTALLGDSLINAPFISTWQFHKRYGVKAEADAAFDRLYILNPDDKEKIRKILEKYAQ